MRTPGLIKVALSVLLISSGLLHAVPVIKEFSSKGGRTTNKIGPEDRMYLVKPGDKITFTVKAEGADKYEWTVNKQVDKKAKGDSFTWTVPNEKGIWEIHVQAGGAYRELAKGTKKIKAIRQEGIKQHLWGGAHQEWVVSTLSAAEAPVFFEYFTDMKTAGRTETDPWGRKLPEWKRKVPNVSEGFARGPAYAHTKSKTAFGTWRFRRKFIDPFYHQVGGYVGLYYIMKGHFDNAYLYGDNMDTHHHCSIKNKEHGRAGFSIEYDGAGTWDDGQWRQVTIVRTRDGHVYMFRDGVLEMHAIDPIPDSSDSIYLQLREPINKRITGLPPTRGPVAVDCLEIYEGKYLFPIKGVKYREYVTNMKPEGWLHLPVKQKGIVVAGRGTRLGDIAKAIDGKYFKKTGENTYTCYTNLIVDDGAELIIKDETLKFHCTKDGQWEFGQNFGSRLEIENSTITSDGEHYFTWNNCAPDTHLANKLSFAHPVGTKIKNLGPDRIYRLRTHDASGYFCFIAKNSTIRNTTKMYFDSPYVLRIENTKFENLRATDIGMYPAGGARNPQTIYRRGIMGKKSFWVTIDDLNVHDFTLRGLTFTGAEPLEITFMTSAFRDRMNIYDVNVGEGKIVLKDVPIPNETQSHTWLPYTHLKKTWGASWIDGKMGLVNCKFKEIVISTTDGKDCNAYALPKYYLDVKVVKPDGSPVSGAKVTVAINTEIGVLASTGWKYDRYNPHSAIPKGCDVKTVWADAEFSPENMEVLRPPPTGKYDNFYLHYRFLAGRKKDSTTTGKDGHTPLPKDAKNTMILTDFVQDKSGRKEFKYTITVEKGGKKKVITGVNPGPEWYRPDPNKPTYTITAVLDGKTVSEAELKKGRK